MQAVLCAPSSPGRACKPARRPARSLCVPVLAGRARQLRQEQTNACGARIQIRLVLGSAVRLVPRSPTEAAVLAFLRLAAECIADLASQADQLVLSHRTHCGPVTIRGRVPTPHSGRARRLRRELVGSLNECALRLAHRPVAVSELPG